MSGEGYPISRPTVPPTEDEYRKQAEYIVRNFPKKFATLSRRLRFAADILALFRYMTDPDVHWAKKALVVGALFYFVVPVDAIPDFAPVVGYLDDMGVIALVVRYLGKQLKGYYSWVDAAPASASSIDSGDFDQSFV